MGIWELVFGVGGAVFFVIGYGLGLRKGKRHAARLRAGVR